MAGISKCSGIECYLKEKCKRYTAEKSLVWQSYLFEPPLKDGKCDMYLDNGIEEKQTQNGNIQLRMYSERN